MCGAPDGGTTGPGGCRACGSAIQRTGAIETPQTAREQAPVGYCPVCRNLQLLLGEVWSPMGPAQRRDR